MLTFHLVVDPWIAEGTMIAVGGGPNVETPMTEPSLDMAGEHWRFMFLPISITSK